MIWYSTGLSLLTKEFTSDNIFSSSFRVVKRTDCFIGQIWHPFSAFFHFITTTPHLKLRSSDDFVNQAQTSKMKENKKKTHRCSTCYLMIDTLPKKSLWQIFSHFVSIHRLLVVKSTILLPPFKVLFSLQYLASLLTNYICLTSTYVCFISLL